MNSKYYYYCILTAIVIVALFHIFAVGRFSYPEFRIKAGQVAEFELIAPFDFPVLKSAEQLVQEQEQTISSIRRPYSPSDEIVFSAYKAIDDIFVVLSRATGEAEAASILEQRGFTFSPELLSPLLLPSTRDKAYTALRTLLENVYKDGIYGEVSGDSILIFRDNQLVLKNKRELTSLDEAIERYNLAFKDVSWAAFARVLAPEIIRENLMLNDAKYRELQETSISQLPVTEGVVLQNEVIIRKNARVTEGDIVKLQSLQEAYREKNVRKSVWQQVLLTLGLLIFNLIIVFAVSYYYQLQNKGKVQSYSEIMPIHLGFVLVVLLSILNNLILGYNNVLIPFALTVLAAAILVSLEFGVFYMVGSFLIVSPFINWETYTPIIFILSCIITMLMIKKMNAFHEYFTIWFYLTTSSIIAGITIAIYKNDQIVVLLKNLGLLVISSTISVIGIMIIVPYYERKWNRATKQTLLELLDFNHPLLKKLATDAVGTYHHSLIVGNLTERAAEAIGANPLLARVGSYYHDIGKVMNTRIFTENNENSSDLHAEYAPEESAELIKHHVLDGIVLANKYKIPRPVIDIIMQHHGTSHIKYFLDQAEKSGREIDPRLFQYPGPKPKSKEAVLVMLADMVESTTKAKTIASEKDIIKIIDDTILRIIKEGQLDDSPISMSDLKIVKESMLPVLESIYRKRLDYPEDRKDQD